MIKAICKIIFNKLQKLSYDKSQQLNDSHRLKTKVLAGLLLGDGELIPIKIRYVHDRTRYVAVTIDTTLFDAWVEKWTNAFKDQTLYKTSEEFEAYVESLKQEAQD